METATEKTPGLAMFEKGQEVFETARGKGLFWNDGARARVLPPVERGKKRIGISTYDLRSQKTGEWEPTLAVTAEDFGGSRTRITITKLGRNEDCFRIRIEISVREDRCPQKIMQFSSSGNGDIKRDEIRSTKAKHLTAAEKRQILEVALAALNEAGDVLTGRPVAEEGAGNPVERPVAQERVSFGERIRSVFADFLGAQRL